MVPTVSQVFASARGHLGDTVVPGGQIFRDNFLINNGHWAAAYEALYRWLSRNGAKAVRRSKYFNLAANQASITPAGMGITDMGEPQDIWDRQVDKTLTATGVVVNAASAGVSPSVDLTIAGHGLLAGAQVVTFGFGMDSATVTDSVNAEWTIAVPDVNTVRLLGCETEDLGNAATATGILSTGTQAFPVSPVARTYELDNVQLTSQNSCLLAWTFENGYFRFIPANAIRQLKISYMISGVAPDAGTVGIDDSRDALALFVAASAAASKFGASGKLATGLFIRAIGNAAGDTTMIRGGAFYELAQLGLKVLTGDRIRQPRYKPRRNIGPYPSVGIGYRSN